MSSVGFTPSLAKEIEKLRETWKALNDVLTNVSDAESCLTNLDLKL